MRVLELHSQMQKSGRKWNKSGRMRPTHCNDSEMLEQLSCLRERAVLKKMDVLSACVVKKLFLYEAFLLKIICKLN